MRNPWKGLPLFLAAVLLTALFSACTASRPGTATPSPGAETPSESLEPVAGGDLTVGIQHDLDSTIDPHNMISAGTREVLFNLYEGLVKPDTTGDLLPAVASDYTVSEGGDSFTFTLREGVTFHSGEAVTAADVVYSVRRAADMGKATFPAFGAVTSVEATDENTVVITLSESNRDFLALLTAGIIPENNEPNEEPIGTGPFAFVSRSPQESVVFKRFEAYWGEPAKVDGVTFKIMGNPEALVMSLKSGAVQLVNRLTSAQVAELGEGFSIVDGSMNIVQGLYLNHDRAPFDNFEVRAALCQAIDRQQIMDFLADGKGFPTGSSMYPAFSKYFRPELVDFWKYDTTIAKEILAKAGYPDGFEMTISVPSNMKPHVDTAEIMAEQLKTIGVTAKIELVDWQTWVDRVYAGRDYQATIIGLDASTLTPRAMLQRFVSSDGSNFTNYNNETYDEVFAEAISAADETEQVELYGRLQTILTEDAANVYLQDMCDFVAMGGGLRGYEFYPMYLMDLSKVYFTK